MTPKIPRNNPKTEKNFQNDTKYLTLLNKHFCQVSKSINHFSNLKYFENVSQAEKYNTFNRAWLLVRLRTISHTSRLCY